MPRNQYRVVYRREGNSATQHRVFGLITTTNEFLTKLLRGDEKLAPLEEVRVDRRRVPDWEEWRSMEDLTALMKRLQ